MSKLRDQVTEFHIAMDVPLIETPKVPSDERVRLRAALIAEECFETLSAMFVFDVTQRKAMISIMRACELAPVSVSMINVADGMADLDYVVEGTRLEFGIDGDPIAVEVHRANMTKVTGPIAPNGKRLKPLGFIPPAIDKELTLQGWKKTERVGHWSLNQLLWFFNCDCKDEKAENVISRDNSQSTCSTCHVKGLRPCLTR